MAKLTLVIGSKNLCSWSLGPWLLLKQSGIVFEERVIRLESLEAPEEIARVSPSGRVPVLMVDDVPIWDSLSIAEFLAEHVTTLWPVDPQTRAEARSITAEVHSGFLAMMGYMPMDFTGRFAAPGKLIYPVEQDVARIQAIWQSFRRRFQAQGPFLCGTFSIADAMFAPICSRLTTYAVPLQAEAEAYRQAMMGLPAVIEWGEGAALDAQTPVASAAPRQITPPPVHVAPVVPPPVLAPAPMAVAPPEPARMVAAPPIQPSPSMTTPLTPPSMPPQAAPAAPVYRPAPVEREPPSTPPEPVVREDGPPRPRRHWLRAPMFREQRAKEAAEGSSEGGGAETTEESPRQEPAVPESRPDNAMIKPIGAGTLRRR